MKTLLPPQGLLFDMDGVLLQATQNPDQSWSIVCQQFAPLLDLPSQELNLELAAQRRAYRKEIENSDEKQQRDRLYPFETRREKVEQALASFGKSNPLLAAEMVRAFEKLRDEHRQLTDNATAVLQTLRDQGLRLALISNGNATYQRRKIAQHHLAAFFDAILLEEEYGKAKPDPLLFLAALEQLHLTPQEAWMIGDNLKTDIAGALALGIGTLWYTPDASALPPDGTPSPDRRISSLSEILDILREAEHSR